MIRARLPGVSPLELWDMPVGRKSLFAWQREPAFPSALAAAVEELQGRTVRFEQIFLTGGGASRPGLVEALRGAGWDVVVASSPMFAAARAGARLAGGSALCADIGQTAIKLFAGGRDVRIERDVVRAPLRDEVPVEGRADARASTLDFLAESLAAHVRPETERAVVALPCAIDKGGVPGGCTYAWEKGDGALTSELATRAGLPETTWLNDAELAAAAAASEPGLARVATLVLTLGFGVGGAMWVPA